MSLGLDVSLRGLPTLCPWQHLRGSPVCPPAMCVQLAAAHQGGAEPQALLQQHGHEAGQPGGVAAGRRAVQRQRPQTPAEEPRGAEPTRRALSWEARQKQCIALFVRLRCEQPRTPGIQRYQACLTCSCGGGSHHGGAPGHSADAASTCSALNAASDIASVPCGPGHAKLKQWSQGSPASSPM